MSKITTYYESNPTFVNAKSILFPGVNQFVTLGTPANLSFERTDPFSKSIWFKTTTTAFDVLMSKFSVAGAETGIQLFFFNSRINFIIGSTGVNRIFVRTNNLFNDDTWRNVVLTYDGSSLASGVHIYVDGNDEALSIINNGLSASVLNSADVELASRAGGGFSFGGNTDEPTWWDKDLNQPEVDEIVGIGEPNNLVAHSAYANLITWLRNGDNDTFPILIDNKGSNNGTMINMVAGDIVLDTP